MAWLRQLVDWQRETEDPAEFLESLRFDLAAGEVYVFTPRGEVVALPQGATPVDFAYAIHTEVGHRTVGARINGRLVALESTLDNGDTVEIFTSKTPDAGPSRDWLKFVQSPRARNKIRQWFSKERREAAVDSGKDQIAKAMRKQGLPLAADRRRRQPAHPGPRPALRRRLRAVRGGRRGPGQRPVRGREAGQVGRRRRRRAGGPSRGHAADQGAAAQDVRGLWRRGQRRAGRVGAAVPVLHPGAGRRDHRLRHPRPRRVRAPGRLREPGSPDRNPARADGRRALGADRRLGLPGRHPGRGAGPDPAALRRDQGAVRPARQHPVRYA